MDCDRIAENLCVGSCPLDSKDLEDLRSLGVTAIMSLQTEEDTGERGIEWEEMAALNAKLAFRNVPVRDFDAPDLQKKLPHCVTVLDYMQMAGHTVFEWLTTEPRAIPELKAI